MRHVRVFGHYGIEEVLKGALEGIEKGEVIRAAIRAIQAREKIPLSNHEPGTVHKLTLEALGSHTELKRMRRVDLLEISDAGEFFRIDS